MANPWFPANSASALSLSRLTPGDSRLLTPPDPDPDNPLSLARFPPLNCN
ncbi:BnaC05g34860D [Brassica napus]|uniref:BnaC05g34860D protein n=1 Tax=Brassica napus TaxID=3708 RepID=A0A078GIL4_BRANA|nr:BnaC05g34860D [Brassica napus]